MKSFKINNLEDFVRIDKWLKCNFRVTFDLIQRLIRKSEIKVNGKKISKDYKLANGDTVIIYAKNLEELPKNSHKPDKESYSNLLAEIKKEIIFKDEHILALNKPYSIATQPGSGIKISIDDILDGLKFGYEIKPRLVHRLDRYTTGILLLARTKQAAELLTKYFKDGLIEKKYLAVVAGNLKNKAGIIKSQIAKFGSKDFKEATTKYKLLSSDKNLKISLVEFSPITGRTHQIRIHTAKDLNSPIIGDIKYGGHASFALGRNKKIHLHSSEIKIKNLFKKNYSLKAKLPTHMQLTIKNFSKTI